MVEEVLMEGTRRMQEEGRLTMEKVYDAMGFAGAGCARRCSPASLLSWIVPEGLLPLGFSGNHEQQGGEVRCLT
jgi:hypothetical protein